MTHEEGGKFQDRLKDALDPAPERNALEPAAKRDINRVDHHGLPAREEAAVSDEHMQAILHAMETEIDLNAGSSMQGTTRVIEPLPGAARVAEPWAQNAFAGADLQTGLAAPDSSKTSPVEQPAAAWSDGAPTSLAAMIPGQVMPEAGAPHAAASGRPQETISAMPSGEGVADPAPAAVMVNQAPGSGMASSNHALAPDATFSDVTSSKAQALPLADRSRGTSVGSYGAEEALALQVAHEAGPVQQPTLVNVVPTGLLLAVAAQGLSNPQAANVTPKPMPVTQARLVPEAAKPAEALTLLAEALKATDAAADVKRRIISEMDQAGFNLANPEGAVKASGEGQAEARTLPSVSLLPMEVMPPRSETPAANTGARELPMPLPARQLAPVVVSLALGRRNEALTIALDPVELGRVEVSIGQGKEAGQVRIVAERPETLALLQRDHRELDRALNQAGLGDMARSLSFSLASDQGRQQQQQGSAHEGRHRSAMIISGLDGDLPIPALPTPLRHATSLIDIAV